MAAQSNGREGPGPPGYHRGDVRPWSTAHESHAATMNGHDVVEYRDANCVSTVVRFELNGTRTRMKKYVDGRLVHFVDEIGYDYLTGELWSWGPDGERSAFVLPSDLEGDILPRIRNMAEDTEDLKWSETEPASLPWLNPTDPGGAPSHASYHIDPLKDFVEYSDCNGDLMRFEVTSTGARLKLYINDQLKYFVGALDYNASSGELRTRPSDSQTWSGGRIPAFGRTGIIRRIRRLASLPQDVEWSGEGEQPEAEELDNVPREAPKVTVAMTIQNVEFDFLNALDKAMLKDRAQQLFADKAGVDRAAVSVGLSKGSVKMKGRICISEGSTKNVLSFLRSIHAALRKESLTRDVLEVLNSIPGFVTAATGDLEITEPVIMTETSLPMETPEPTAIAKAFLGQRLLLASLGFGSRDETELIFSLHHEECLESAGFRYLPT